jgi:hypothetical protein
MDHLPETSENTADHDDSNAVDPAQNLPGFLGRLTPEEHRKLLGVRDESRMLMQKVGELEVQKARIMQRIDVLDGEGQEVINSVSRRVGISDGQQWIAHADGKIILVNPAAAKEGAAPS